MNYPSKLSHRENWDEVETEGQKAMTPNEDEFILSEKIANISIAS